MHLQFWLVRSRTCVKISVKKVTKLCARAIKCHKYIHEKFDACSLVFVWWSDKSEIKKNYYIMVLARIRQTTTTNWNTIWFDFSMWNMSVREWMHHTKKQPKNHSTDHRIRGKTRNFCVKNTLNLVILCVCCENLRIAHTQQCGQLEGRIIVGVWCERHPVCFLTHCQWSRMNNIMREKKSW